MAKYEFEGMDEYIKQLERIGKSATGMIKRAVFDGAAKVGDAFVAEINAIPTIGEHYFSGDVPIYGITAKQKAGLLEGFGFAKMKDEGGVINTKAGFDGYNSVKTAKFPNGQPNALIANAINHGTSRRPRTNFVNKAVNASKSNAEAAMAARFDEDMKELIKE